MPLQASSHIRVGLGLGFSRWSYRKHRSGRFLSQDGLEVIVPRTLGAALGDECRSICFLSARR